MTDPYANLTPAERELVVLIATAMGKGVLLPHNKVTPKAARRVFDTLMTLDCTCASNIATTESSPAEQSVFEW